MKKIFACGFISFSLAFCTIIACAQDSTTTGQKVKKAVKKTGKAIIVQEDSLFGGIASDLSALIMENCFEYLDAPVKRVASLDSPIPFTKALEDQYLPKGRFEKELLDLIAY